MTSTVHPPVHYSYYIHIKYNILLRKRDPSIWLTQLVCSLRVHQLLFHFRPCVLWFLSSLLTLQNLFCWYYFTDLVNATTTLCASYISVTLSHFDKGLRLVNRHGQTVWSPLTIQRQRKISLYIPCSCVTFLHRLICNHSVKVSALLGYIINYIQFLLT